MTRTTINLLFFLLIVSVIAGYVFSNSANALKKTRFAVNDYNLASLNTAVELYYADNNFYPRASDSQSLIEGLKSGGYIKGIVADSSLFVYRFSDNGELYSLSLKQ